MIRRLSIFRILLVNLIMVHALLLISVTLNAQIFMEAEGYSEMSGIQTQPTEDSSGGLNIGWIDAGDWMEYEVSVPMSGDYVLSVRAASESGGGLLSVEKEGEEISSVAINSTGGWQAWETVNGESLVSLPEGDYTIKLVISKGGFNINWFAFTLGSPIDTDAPTIPVIVHKEESVHGGVLTWNASADVTSAIAGYKVFNGSKLAMVTTDTSVNIENLPPDLTLNIGVVAFDVAGNSSDTARIEFTTTEMPWDLLWSDEFDYTGAPDPEKWWFETGGDGWGNEEAQYYTNGDNANVEDGMLVIEARKESYANNEFTSSRINSMKELDFLYGRVEVKAKLPSTQGSWPAIWTLPTDWVYGGWPACGEIDIMEHSILTGYGYTFGTVHTGSYNHQDGTQQSGGITFEDVTDTWHTYVIEWYPDHIDWYVDDIHIFRFDNEYKTTDEWPYDIKHHLILNVAVGGGLGGEIDMDGEWPQRMLIDYVRVYDFKLGENDTIAPEPVTGLEAEVSGTMVDLTWNSAADNYAVKEYHVLKDGAAYDTVQATSISVYGLEAETEYLLSVLATDYSDNVSSAVSTTVVTTIDKGIEIPGIVEAEDYHMMEGIETEETEDDGGGLNVGYISGGDWMTYIVEVTEAKTYRAGFRVAAESTSGDITLSIDDEILASVETSITGGWQNWQTVVSEPFDLEIGTYTIKLSTEQGGFNLNYIEFKGEDEFVGIDDMHFNELVIYPNPVEGNELTIVLPADAQNAEVSVISLDGRIIYQEIAGGNELFKLTSQEWVSGVYLVSVTTQDKVYTQKIYKQ